MEEAKMIKVSDLMVKALENEGVQFIFGIPGEENLDFVESLRASKQIKLVLTRHEQAAGFMAATVGRLTGKIGVAISTLGPGATNFTTAAAFAQLGGMPCFFFTGQKGIRDTKQGSFQIVDVVEMMRPLTKFTKQITDGNILAASVRKATRIATLEKPGPVHLELPEDIAHEMTADRVFEPTVVRRPVTDEKGIAEAVKLLLGAKRPLMLVGAAANRQRAVRALREFSRELGVASACTQMGKGILDEREPNFMGCAALSSKDYVHNAIDMADIVINVGHDSTEKPPFLMAVGENSRKVIHIGFEAALVDNVYFPTVEVVGDIANAVWQIRTKLQAAGKSFEKEGLPLFHRLKEMNDVCLAQGTNDAAFPMNILRVVADVRKVLPEDGRLSLDNGLYKVFFARTFPAYHHNTVLLDNALATMGAGLPNAIAARMVDPSRKVIGITGDGGWLMNCPELATAVQYGVSMVMLVLNDNAFGMIRWKQKNMGFEDWGLDLKNPDLVKHAESFGAHGHRVTSTDEFGPLLQRCLDAEGVHVIEVPISYEWAKAKLKEIPAEAEEIKRRAMAEFGDDIVVEDSLPNPEAPPAMTEAAEKCGDMLDAHAPKAQSAKPATPTPDPGQHQQPRHESIAQGSNVPFYLCGKPQAPNSALEVLNKYTGEVFCTVAQAEEAEIERAIAVGHDEGVRKMAALPAYKRKAILLNVVEKARERAEEFARMLAIEAGKPIKDSRGEVARLIRTFEVAAEEAVRIYGEHSDLSIGEREDGYSAITKRFPIGLCSFISPFNFPLNLAAHKVAPAIAAGCPFVLKPASRTPLGALLLGEILAADPNMPPEGFSILPATRAASVALTEDDRFKLLSFTGSPEVGWDLKKRAGKKPVVLELGGNAACIVDDLAFGEDRIIDAIVHGAYYQSGQSCISTQRLFVRSEYYERVREALVQRVAELKMGDPLEEDTFIGPVISSKEADRIKDWIDEAVSKGGKLLCGGERSGLAMVSAALLEHVPHDAKLHTEELFGPGLVMEPFTDFKTVVEQINDSKFGLQAGVFTSRLDRAHYAFEHIDAGGVCINATPSVRIDSQPYGGVKDSGLGREGLRYAIEDMTELRVMVLKDAASLLN